jgi:trehalose 6-phosphate synthase/phosphatase
MDRRWLVVSNRLPFSLDAETGTLQRGSGGLVTALSSAESKSPRVWVGVGEIELENHNHRAEMEAQGVERLVPITIDEKLYEDYYTGFSNDVLWPLFHYQSNLVNFRNDAWEAYQKVNQIFADKLIEEVREGDLVWIHDYHLFLLPALLRKKLSDRKINVRIGFFLHIPWPSSEVYRQLPVREEILKGLLGADLVGFHDYSYLRHFSSCLESLLGLESDLYHVRDDRTIQLGVFPVSIDPKKHLEALKDPAVQKRVAELRDSGEGKLILGVDRLDYSKGIDLKFEIFRRFLRSFPEWVGKVRLVQVAVPTRQSSPEYQRLKERIDRIVGDINGEFSRPGYTPINYIYSTVDFRELTALYNASDLLLVTSTRDGMNLVALEFLASQDSEDPGVLMLSEFAGVSAFLAFCALINPWDLQGSSNALNQGLSLPRGLRIQQHQGMLAFLQNYSSSQWGQTFMSALSKEEEVTSPTTTIHLRAKDLNMGVDTLRSLRDRYLFILLDYDGTLVPITDHPDLAVLQEEVGDLIKSLSKLRNVEVTIISGRNREFLKSQFSGIPVGLAAEHGAQVYFPDEKRWRTGRRIPLKPWYEMAEQIMNDYCSRIPMSFVEKKARSIVWHYRRSPAPFADYQALRLASDLRYGLSEFPINILSGKKIIEVRSIDAHKGRFFTNYRQERVDDKRIRDPIFLALGDDLTDEDIFKEASRADVTVKIGSERTFARFRIATQSEVVAFLRKILDLRQRR